MCVPAVAPSLGRSWVELQASGKTIQELQAEEDEAHDFEIGELFDDIGAATEDDDLVAGDEPGAREELPE